MLSGKRIDVSVTWSYGSLPVFELGNKKNLFLFFYYCCFLFLLIMPLEFKFLGCFLHIFSLFAVINLPVRLYVINTGFFSKMEPKKQQKPIMVCLVQQKKFGDDNSL